MWRNKRPHLHFIFAIALTTSVWSQPNWEPAEHNNIPWMDAQAIVTYNNKIFLSAETSKEPGDSTRLWTTVDTVQWTPVYHPELENFVIESFLKTIGLYAFGRTPSGERRALYTTDGNSWSRIDNGSFGNGNWSDSIEYKNHIYAVGTDGQYWRTTGIDPNWTLLPTPPFSNMDYLHFETLGDHLFVSAANNIPLSDLYLYRSVNGTSWVMDRPFWEPSSIHPGYLTKIDNIIYHDTSLGTSRRIEIDGNGSVKYSFATPYGRTRQIFGKLHAFQLLNAASYFPPTVQFYGGTGALLFSQGSNPQFCEKSFGKFSNIAELGDFALYISCDLWRIRQGVNSIFSNHINSTILSPGQFNTPVLSWTVGVAYEENLNHIVIQNKGSAENGIDIAKLILNHKIPNQNGGFDLVPLTDLLPSSNVSTWSTSDSFVLNSADDVDLVVTANLSPNARTGKTIDLILQNGGIQWNVSQSFAHNIVKNDNPFIIQGSFSATVQDPIESVVVYPKPARDTVRFLYDLNSTADVFIKIFDRNGLLVSELSETGKAANSRAMTLWDATDKGAGVYYATIKITSATEGERFYKKKVYLSK